GGGGGGGEGLGQDAELRGELTILDVDVSADRSGCRALVGGCPVDPEVLLPAGHQGVVSRAAGWRRVAGGGACRGKDDDQATEERKSQRAHRLVPLKQAYHRGERSAPAPSG